MTRGTPLLPKGRHVDADLWDGRSAALCYSPVHLPGGSPKKRVNRANNEISPICSLKIRVLIRRFLAFSEGPGGFRELLGGVHKI